MGSELDVSMSSLGSATGFLMFELTFLPGVIFHGLWGDRLCRIPLSFTKRKGKVKRKLESTSRTLLVGLLAKPSIGSRKKQNFPLMFK